MYSTNQFVIYALPSLFYPLLRIEAIHLDTLVDNGGNGDGGSNLDNLDDGGGGNGDGRHGNRVAEAGARVHNRVVGALGGVSGDNGDTLDDDGGGGDGLGDGAAASVSYLACWMVENERRTYTAGSVTVVSRKAAQSLRRLEKTSRPKRVAPTLRTQLLPQVAAARPAKAATMTAVNFMLKVCCWSGERKRVDRSLVRSV